MIISGLVGRESYQNVSPVSESVKRFENLPRILFRENGRRTVSVAAMASLNIQLEVKLRGSRSMSRYTEASLGDL